MTNENVMPWTCFFLTNKRGMTSAPCADLPSRTYVDRKLTRINGEKYDERKILDVKRHWSEGRPAYHAWTTPFGKNAQ